MPTATFHALPPDRRERLVREAITEFSERSYAEASLSQIAQMLDYADSSAFSRSCRRWFGEAPRTYRLRLTQARNKAKAPPAPKGSRVNSLTAHMRASSRYKQ